MRRDRHQLHTRLHRIAHREPRRIVAAQILHGFIRQLGHHRRLQHRNFTDTTALKPLEYGFQNRRHALAREPHDQRFFRAICAGYRQ